MLQIHDRCYVNGNGPGTVEAVCNDKPKGGVSISYCVRLDKESSKLQWFDWYKVEHYDDPKKDDQDQDKAKTRRKG
jgi:hypothetical protein